MPRWPLCALLAFAALPARANPALSYRYDDRSLFLAFQGRPMANATIEWRPLNSKGLPGGKFSRKELTLHDGPNEIDLVASEAAGHEVIITIEDRVRRLIAHRGVWFGRPTDRVEREEIAAGLGSGMVDPRDVFLAGGLRVTAQSQDPPLQLELGRTFGPEDSAGVAVMDRRAFVLVARGPTAAVRLTLAVRRGKSQMSYFDYPLVLGPEFRRYAIPLDRFTLREKPKARLATIHSFAIRAVERSKRGDKIEVDFVGLARAAPEVRAIGRTSRGIKLQVSPGYASDAAVLYSVADGGKASGAPQAAGTVTSSAARYFLCAGAHARDPARASCDPPDAPLTRYPPPPVLGAPLILDDFSSAAPVNAHRLPAILIYAAPDQADHIRARRINGALELSYEPPSAETTTITYGGYSTAIPSSAGGLKGYGAVELALRGTASTRAIRIGLRDAKGNEPKIALGDYLDEIGPSFWSVARVPLEAFRAARARPKQEKPSPAVAITLTMAPQPGARSMDLAIDQIALIPARPRLVLARFDGEPIWQTSFGGVIREEHGGGGKIDLSASPDGGGRAMSAAVSAISAERGYALVLLGLGRVDASGYQALTFRVRGERGGEVASILIADRKKKSAVELADHAKVGTSWGKVRVPLASFDKKVDRRALYQIGITWEGRLLDGQKMYFDDFALE